MITNFLHRLRSQRRALGAIVLAVSGSAIALGGVAMPLVPFSAAPATAEAATTPSAPLQNGANIMSTWNGDFGSSPFDQSLNNLAATGANYVTLNIPLYQTSVTTTDVGVGGGTPTAAALTSGIAYAHSLGLHVMLKFDVFPADNNWSGLINPSDRSGWFTNYQRALTPFIQIAQSTGVEEICLGDELVDMTADDANPTNTSHWFSLIAAVRGMYSGKLTYGANWGGNGDATETSHIDFWSALDYIGISAYYNLSGDGSVPSLLQSWAQINTSTIQPLEAQWNKPVLFTEIGYMAIADSYTHPWEWWETGNADETAQANDYQALFQYWDTQPNFAGTMLWDWSDSPTAGGPNDNGYTPQGKTAQSVMQQFFTSTSSSGGSGGAGGVAPAFSASATYSPSTPAPGQDVSFMAKATNSGGAVSNANVDMEIYNSSGSQVYQKIFSGQTIAGNASQNYTFDWTAGAAGSYVLKVGVFSGDWSQEYYWGNQVEPITVINGQLTNNPGGGNGGNSTTTAAGGSGGNSTSTAGAPTSTLPANAAIDVWWPTNCATVTGVQPFKAMIPNADVDSYTMYWQVDGGQLNPMQDNNTDYPHKEASVDVDPWTWRGTGPYVVVFVAKDLNGDVIATATSTIYN
jgi:hypothetical protein